MIKTSIFNDEVSSNLREALNLLDSWGQEIVDLRENIFGNTVIDDINERELSELMVILSGYKFEIGCIGSRKLICDPGMEKNELFLLLNKLNKLTKIAKTVKTAYIRICTLAPRPDDEDSRQKMLESAVPLMKELANHAAKEGIILLLENKPTSITNSGREMSDFLYKVNHENIKIQWDAVNSWIGGFKDFEKDYMNCREFIASVHLKGAMGKKDEPEIYDRGGLMGQDDVPHEKIIENLIRDGFKNNITLDLSVVSVDRNEFNLSDAEIAKASLEYTKGVIKRLSN